MYFFSNLVEHLTNLVMKAWSRLIPTLHQALAVHDFTVGIGLGVTSGVELDSGSEWLPKVEENSFRTALHDVGVELDIDMTAGVELSKGIGVGKDCVDESKKVEEFSRLWSFEHIVQFDNMRWYLLFSKVSCDTLFFN